MHPNSRTSLKRPAIVSADDLLGLSAEEFTHLLQGDGMVGPRQILADITQLEVLVEKLKASDKKNPAQVDFYNRIVRIMYQAMMAEDNINFWRGAVHRMKLELKITHDTAAAYFEELLKYKTIEQLQGDGTLDQYIAAVKARTQETKRENG